MDDVATLARVEVSRAIFVEEIRRLKKGGRRNAGDAILALRDDHFCIAWGGGEVRLPAHGRWPGEARAAFDWLAAMGRVPPAMDPLVFEVREGRLRLGGSSIGCEWQRKDSAVVQLPVNAGWVDVLRAGLLHDDATLQQSGLLAQVEQARRKASLVLQKAYPPLNEFGVTLKDIDDLVNQVLLRSGD